MGFCIVEGAAFIGRLRFDVEAQMTGIAKCGDSARKGRDHSETFHAVRAQSANVSKRVSLVIARCTYRELSYRPVLAFARQRISQKLLLYGTNLFHCYSTLI
jgi:hypothetical protein